MSTYSYTEYKCALCGEEDLYQILTSTNACGFPDLDFRPPEMQRSTMHYWVQECRNCGYVSNKLSDKTKLKKSFVKSAEYITCNGLKEEFLSELAVRFYKHAMIQCELKNYADAAQSYLNAAWASDDRDDEAMAVHCRNKVLECMACYAPTTEELGYNDILRKADLLRRTKRFDELISFLDSPEVQAVKDKDYKKVLDFQRSLAMKGDTKCYSARYALDE